MAALSAQDPVRNGQLLGVSTNAARRRAERLAFQAQGRVLARAHDPLHQAGCMLYWAEGAKARNSVDFANADVEMHRFFIRFLTRCYAVSPAAIKLRLTCHLGNGLTLEEIEGYWLAELGLDRASLRKSIVVAPSVGELKRRKIPYGTARLSVDSTALVQSIYGAIQEYAGFDRSEWLDQRK